MKLQFKRGLQANLPVLDVGEPGLTTDQNRFFIGGTSGNIELAKKGDLIPGPPGPKGDGYAIDVKDYGAKGDGVTDDTASIQKAYDYAHEIGGGIVFFLPGTYITTGNVYYSNTVTEGSGIGITTLKLKDNTPGVSVLNSGDAVENVAFINFSIDGNRDNQTIYGHGIRNGTVGGITNGYFGNLYVKNAGAYGIGLQKGTYKNVRFENITVENSGLDGIDLKNESNNNDNIFYSKITILNHGLDPTQTGQAGLDCRGPVIMSDIIVRGVATDRVGIRFRDNGPETGLGGFKSSLTNFSVYGDGAGTASIGVDVVNSDIRVSNGYVESTSYGVVVEVSSPNVQMSNVEVKSVGVNGFQVSSPNVTMDNCSVYSAAAYGVRAQANNLIMRGCIVNSCTLQGVRLNVGLTGILLADNILTGNTLGAIRDDGATYSAHNNAGWVTEVNLISSSIDTSTSGTKTFTVAHGMNVTPNLQDIALTIINDVSNGYTISFFRIDSVDATNITGRVVVGTGVASTSVKVGLKVKSKV